MQDRHEPSRVDFTLADQQRAQLGVAVLLDNENAVVRGNEVEDVVVKREGADACLELARPRSGSS